MDRREFIGLLGTGAGLGALAGCAGDTRDTDSPGSAPSPSPTGPPTETSTGTAPTVDPLDGSWESYRHDAGNTAATDDPGPTAEPTELWRRATTTGEPATSPAAADGAFFLVTRSGVVYARAADDGAVRWSSDRTVDADIPPVATDGTVVVAGVDTLAGLSAGTGEERWTVALDGRVTGLATLGDGIVATSGSGIAAVAPDGAERWRRPMDGTVATAPGSGGGTVAVGLSSGAVLALDGTDGEQRWRTPVGSEPAFAPAVGDGGVYVGAGSCVVALDAERGTERWEYDTDHPVAATPAPTPGGVYISTLEADVGPPSTGTSRETGTPTPYATDTMWLGADLVALSAGEGTERWRSAVTERYSFTSGPPERLPVTTAEDRVLLGVGGELLAYDAATGEPAWSAEADAVRPAVTEGVVSTGRAGLDATDGSVRWRFRTGRGINASPAVVGNTAYVGSDDQYVYALAADTGAVEWAVPTDGMVRASPAVGDGAVYVGTMDGSLYAFDRANGTERWRTRLGGQVQSPALADGTLYVGNFSQTVYAVDADDGSDRWRTEVDGDRFVALTLAVADGAVFAGANGDLRAFDTADGNERWSVVLDREVVQSSPVAADGTVYVNLGDSVRAFDAADGSERWSRTTGGSHHPPAVGDGTVYTPSEGAVHAFDATDGTERWRAGVGTDLALAVGDAVYGLAHDAPVLALDTEGGDLLWRHGGPEWTTPPAIAGEYLFLGDGTGRVHALGQEPERD